MFDKVAVIGDSDLIFPLRALGIQVFSPASMEEARQLLKELEDKLKKVEEAKIELAKFQVLRSRFYKQKRKYRGAQPIIELTVKNGTKYSVSRAYFKGTLASPDRAVPWLKETFNYKISGGLEPGEEATWKLSPNMFSEWGSVDAPADAILTVEVEQLDGPNEEELFSTRNFSEYDADRLKRLNEQYFNMN